MKNKTLRQAIVGRNDKSQASFNEVAFAADWHVPFLLVFGFIRRFTLRELHIVKGDNMLALVASEIWIYNITQAIFDQPTFSSLDIDSEDERLATFKGCNGYSIAQYLNVSPETVRRKVKKLIEMGWVVRNKSGKLITTTLCDDAFNPSANLETMRDFISSSRALFNYTGMTLVMK